MKLGIKTGLKSDYKKDIEATRPDFVEIWFHSGKISEYNELFNYLKSQNIPFGLHFWGVLNKHIEANLSFPDPQINVKSIELVRQTIDMASENNCLYVNVHPGAQKITIADFEKEKFDTLSEVKPIELCETILRKSLKGLANYANEKNVPLYVESVPKFAPGRPWYSVEGRNHPVEFCQIGVPIIEKMLDIPNLYFTNDFGHTASNIISESRNKPLKFLQNIARRLAEKTRLLHVSYIIPPYNGVDYHGCLYNDEFKSSLAVPNYSEILELLKLFVYRKDVYALVEPEKNHPGNFAFLQQLVQQALK